MAELGRFEWMECARRKPAGIGIEIGRLVLAGSKAIQGKRPLYPFFVPPRRRGPYDCYNLCLLSLSSAPRPLILAVPCDSRHAECAETRNLSSIGFRPLSFSANSTSRSSIRDNRLVVLRWPAPSRTVFLFRDSRVGLSQTQKRSFLRDKKRYRA